MTISYTKGSGGSSGGINSNSINAHNGIYENNQIVPNDYNVATGHNAFSAGPITIADGKVVKIPPGAVWLIG